jgi:hypothetical protein
MGRGWGLGHDFGDADRRHDGESRHYGTLRGPLSSGCGWTSRGGRFGDRQRHLGSGRDGSDRGDAGRWLSLRLVGGCGVKRNRDRLSVGIGVDEGRSGA